MNDDIDITAHSTAFYRVPGERQEGPRLLLPEREHAHGDLEFPSDLKTWRQVERWLKNSRSHEKEYKRSHPVKVRVSKRRTEANRRERCAPAFDALRLERPFVVIDSEGQDYDGDDIIRDNTRYKEHGTYLWRASTDDSNKPTHILRDPDLSGSDKRKLDVKAIVDWLLSLPNVFRVSNIT